MPIGQSLLSRRATLATLASAPAIITSAPRAFADATPVLAPTPACTLTPAAISGPYYFDPKLVRRDITEGHPGAPLRLRFVVMDAANCTPISGARIDVWHTRADGYYSGYPGQGDKRNVDTSGGTFMRGTQIADERGEVLFDTVYPAWYLGRTVHVHFKIFIAEGHADGPDVFPRCAQPVHLRQCRRLSAQSGPHGVQQQRRIRADRYDPRRLLRHQGRGRPLSCDADHRRQPQRPDNTRPLRATARPGPRDRAGGGAGKAEERLIKLAST
jgi:hypothetical protein